MKDLWIVKKTLVKGIYGKIPYTFSVQGIIPYRGFLLEWGRRRSPPLGVPHGERLPDPRPRTRTRAHEKARGRILRKLICGGMAMAGALFGAFCGFGPPKTPIFAWYFQLFRKPGFTSRKCMNSQGILVPFCKKCRKSLI